MADEINEMKLFNQFEDYLFDIQETAEECKREFNSFDNCKIEKLIETIESVRENINGYLDLMQKLANAAILTNKLLQNYNSD